MVATQLAEGSILLRSKNQTDTHTQPVQITVVCTSRINPILCLEYLVRASTASGKLEFSFHVEL